MRWAVLLLLAANLALFGYLFLIDRNAGSVPNVRALELNADKIRQIKPLAAGAGAQACLEWGNLGGGELARAQQLLAELKVGKTSVRERQILIVEPSPALTVRLAELKAGFPGTELKAVVCPASGA